MGILHKETAKALEATEKAEKDRDTLNYLRYEASCLWERLDI